MSDTTIIKGEPVTPEQKAQFDALRALFDPKTGMDRLDAYGKWLFGSGVIVGSLGAGLSSSVLPKLRGLGTWSFVLAVVAFGICLIAASFSIAPKWVTVRMTDLESLRTAINEQFKERQKYLTTASVFFGVALALSGISPLLSLNSGTDLPVLHYSKDNKGALSVGVEGDDMQPGTIIGVRLEVGGISKVSASSTVDRIGSVKVILPTTDLSSLPGNAQVVVCQKKPEEKDCADIARSAVL